MRLFIRKTLSPSRLLSVFDKQEHRAQLRRKFSETSVRRPPLFIILLKQGDAPDMRQAYEFQKLLEIY